MLQNDLIAINLSVQIWKSLQSPNAGLHKEGHKAQLGIVPLHKLLLSPLSHLHHRAHINFLECRQHRGRLLGFNQTAGNRPAAAGHPYPFLTALSPVFFSRRGWSSLFLGRFRRRFLFGLFFTISLDILLRYPATRSGSRNLADIHPLFFRHPAGNRRDPFLTIFRGFRRFLFRLFGFSFRFFLGFRLGRF